MLEPKKKRENGDKLNYSVKQTVFAFFHSLLLPNPNWNEPRRERERERETAITFWWNKKHGEKKIYNLPF